MAAPPASRARRGLRVSDPVGRGRGRMPGPRGPLPPELPHSPRDAGTALPLPERAASSSRCAPAAPPRGVPPTRARPPQGPPRPVRRHLARCLALPFITGPCAQATACPTPEPLDRQLMPINAGRKAQESPRTVAIIRKMPGGGGGHTRSSQSPQISANSHHDYFSSAEGTAQASIG